MREIGKLLGVPTTFIARHPFPGPGLAVRVLGDVTEEGKLDTLREVDEIYVNTIREFGLYDQIWQVGAEGAMQRTVCLSQFECMEPGSRKGEALFLSHTHMHSTHVHARSDHTPTLLSVRLSRRRLPSSCRCARWASRATAARTRTWWRCEP